MRRVILLCVAAVLAGCSGAAPGGPPRQPNFIVILTDDFGFEIPACYGGESYSTPRIDRLAAEGMRFDRAYCTPLCGPTRQQILTGRYGFRTGQVWGTIPASERTFGHVMRNAGYATAAVGKWQLGIFQNEPDHAKKTGFDACSLWTWRWNGKKPGRYWNPSIWQDGKLLEVTKEDYGPDMQNEYLIDFIRKNRDRPFCVYYPMTLVHGPMEPTPDHRDRGPGHERFADNVAYLDKLVGDLVDAIDELGLAERTMIVFTGDNGTGTSETSKYRGRSVRGGKGKMTDFGCRVPFIVRWPGTVPAGSVCDELTDFTDLLPTMAEFAGVTVPRGLRVDGRSIAQLLRTGKGGPREWVFVQLWDVYCMRDKRWKLYNDGRFFDAEADPAEQSPLPKDAGGEAAAGRAKLQAALDELARDPDWRAVERDKNEEREAQQVEPAPK